MQRRRQNVQEEEDVAQLKLGEDFATATPMLNSEVAILLEHKKSLESSRDTEQSATFLKTHEYVDRFSKYKNKTTVKDIRTLLEQRGLEPYEIAALANLCPESLEEAVSLIPSLNRHPTEDVEGAIADLASFKRFD